MKKILLVTLIALLPYHAAAALKTNETAPVFSLQDLGNSEFSLDNVVGPASRGKNRGVVLSFFASWCLPCRVELPMLDARVDELAGKGIRVVLVGVREDRAKIEALMTELKVSKPTVLSDSAGKVSGMYQVRFLPTTFFIGSDGQVKDIIFGEIRDEAELRASIEKLLK